jgi:hypothetical protein
MCRLGGHTFIFPCCSTLRVRETRKKKKYNAKANERENAKFFKNKCFFTAGEQWRAICCEFLASQSEHSDTSLKKRIFSDFFNFILFTLSFFSVHFRWGCIAIREFFDFARFRDLSIITFKLSPLCVRMYWKFSDLLPFLSLLWCAMSPR